MLRGLAAMRRPGEPAAMVVQPGRDAARLRPVQAVTSMMEPGAAACAVDVEAP